MGEICMCIYVKLLSSAINTTYASGMYDIILYAQHSKNAFSLPNLINTYLGCITYEASKHDYSYYTWQA